MTQPHTVITGGEGSLARAIAKELVQSGLKVSAPGRLELDVTDEKSVSRYFETTEVDLLVCAAGITRDSPLARMTDDSWNEVWNVNYKGAATCANAVLKNMVARKKGHIIFISSFSALHPPVGQTAYATAKAALLGLVDDLATRHGSSNIRINAVLPGFLETTMTRDVSAKRRAEVLHEHVLGRFNTTSETARFISFLHHSMPHTSAQVFQLDSRPG